MIVASLMPIVASALFISSSLAAPSTGIHAKPDIAHHHHLERDAADHPPYVISKWNRIYQNEDVPLIAFEEKHAPYVISKWNRIYRNKDAAATVETRNVENDDPWAALDDVARAVVRNTASKSLVIWLQQTSSTERCS